MNNGRVPAQESICVLVTGTLCERGHKILYIFQMKSWIIGFECGSTIKFEKIHIGSIYSFIIRKKHFKSLYDHYILYN